METGVHSKETGRDATGTYLGTYAGDLVFDTQRLDFWALLWHGGVCVWVWVWRGTSGRSGPCRDGWSVDSVSPGFGAARYTHSPPAFFFLAVS
jgi:hypothetical protein